MTWVLNLWVEGVDLNPDDPATTMAVVEDDTDLANSEISPRLLGDMAHTTTIEDELWPAQHREQLTFNLVAATAEEVAGLENGNRVACAWRSPGGAVVLPTDPDDPSPWLWEFYGQVTGAKMETHEKGVVVAVTAVGYVHTELAEDATGTDDWAEESCGDRVDNILAGEEYANAGMPLNDPDLAARDAKRESSLSVVEKILDSWVQTDGAGGRGRFVLEPIVYASIASPYYEIDQAVRHGWLLVDVWRTNVVLVDGGTITADNVDLDASWTNRRDLNVTRVVATGPTGAAGKEETQVVSNADDGPNHRVTRKYDTDLVNVAPVTRVAELYLPDDGLSPWHPDTFTWYLDREADGTELPPIGSVVTILGLQARHNPSGDAEYLGQTVRRRFYLDQGKPRVELDLRPVSPETTPGIDGGTAKTTHTDVVDGGPAADAQVDLVDGGNA